MPEKKRVIAGHVGNDLAMKTEVTPGGGCCMESRGEMDDGAAKEMEVPGEVRSIEGEVENLVVPAERSDQQHEEAHLGAGSVAGGEANENQMIKKQRKQQQHQQKLQQQSQPLQQKQVKQPHQLKQLQTKQHLNQQHLQQQQPQQRQQQKEQQQKNNITPKNKTNNHNIATQNNVKTKNTTNEAQGRCKGNVDPDDWLCECAEEEESQCEICCICFATETTKQCGKCHADEDESEDAVGGRERKQETDDSEVVEGPAEGSDQVNDPDSCLATCCMLAATLLSSVCYSDVEEEEVKEETALKDPACCVCGSTKEVKRCGGCSLTSYCSKECQVSHRPHHQVYCHAISSLMKIERDKIYKDKSVRQKQVDYKMSRKLAKLVGEKPKLECYLDHKKVQMLWDTGSMVSLVDREWLNKHFPSQQLFPVSDFVDNPDRRFNLQAANSSDIEFDGVALLNLTLSEEEEEGMLVPVLVASGKIAEPILGYNVIELLILEGDEALHKKLASCFLTTCPFNIDPLVAMVKTQAESKDFLTEIKIPEAVTVPAGYRKRIRCRVKAVGNDEEQTVCFWPKVREDEEEVEFLESVSTLKRGHTNYVHVEVINQTRKDQVLQKGSVVGSVHSVAAVVPMVRMFEDVRPQKVSVNAVGENSSAEEAGQPGNINTDLSHLTEDQQKAVREVLLEVQDMFSTSDSDIGDIPDFHMKINVNDDVPVKEAYRRIPRNLYSEVKNYVDDLMKNGWVRESFSSFASPIVCARKKDGGLRLCVDYRKLNAKTPPDCQPIPRIQDILDGLAGQKWFSTLDMSKAYHQGYIAEDSRHLTAFATPWALLEWIRIPFGLRNAPPAFQRFMNQVLGDMKGKICEPYIDDVLIYAKSFEQGVQNLRKVLLRLRSRGVKLRAHKCVFLKNEVRYLGRLVSEHGYRPDPEDTKALEKFRTPPSNVGELRSLLGFFGYYRCYVKDFAKKVKPLYDLLKGDKSEGGDVKKKVKVVKAGQRYDSKEAIVWLEEHQVVVDGLIDYLKSPDVIAYPDFDLPFFLTCDASNHGLGSVLYQTQQGVDRVIGYASRTLSEAEKNYNFHSGKLEFLALKWAVTERFSDYLHYGQSFQVFTDNNPLTYVLTSAKLNAVGMRWAASLAEYNFTIKYKPGKENVDADYLSRRPLDIMELKESCTETFESAGVGVVLSNAGAGRSDMAPCDVSICSLAVESEEIVQVSREELIEAQKADPVIAPVMTGVLTGTRPRKEMWKQLSRQSKLLMRNFSKLKVVEGLLVRETVKYTQVVLPETYHQLVYVELHEKMAHLGAEKVINLAAQRFYWPNMGRDIEEYIRKKCRCVVSKKPNVAERAPLVPIHATYPFEMVSLDFLKLDKCKGGYEYVLVIVDHFTRFCQMYATRKKSSKAAASKLWGEFIMQFGFPKRIHHDLGGEFNSDMFRELHRLSGVKSSNTTPYHPEGDGQTERLNRSALNMLKSLGERQKKNWKDSLPKMAFAYNSTVNKSTGYSPFYLMFGRESSLPIDQMFGLEVSDKVTRKTHREFVEEWKASLEEAHTIANKNIEKAGDYNKEHYDKRVHGVEIEVGDHVLVQNKREKGGTGKLRNHFEADMFVVEEKNAKLPVYTIRNLNKNKDVRSLHRNLLKRVNEMSPGLFEEAEEVKKQAPKKPCEKKKVAAKEVDEQVEEESDAEGGVIVYQEQIPIQIEGEGAGDMAVPEGDELMAGREIEEREEGDDIAVPEPTELVEDYNPDADAGPEDLVMDSDEEDQEPSSSDSEAEQPIRRSSRNVQKRRVLTYDELGGAPRLTTQ